MGLGRLLVGAPVRQALTSKVHVQRPIILEGLQLESIAPRDLERSISSYSATTSTDQTSAPLNPVSFSSAMTGLSLGRSLQRVLPTLPWSASLFGPSAHFSTTAFPDAPASNPTSESSPEIPPPPEQRSSSALLKDLSQARLPFKAHSSIADSSGASAGRHMATSSLAAQPEADSQSQGAKKASKALPPLPPRKKTKALTKTAQHIMNILNQEAVAAEQQKKNYPDFRAGDVLELDLIVPENRRRTQVIRGVCIARRNSGIGSSFVIRRVVAGEGMEYTYPLYSPNIQKIKIIERRPVRRSKLYFLREWNPRECTV